MVQAGDSRAIPSNSDVVAPIKRKNVRSGCLHLVGAAFSVCRFLREAPSQAQYRAPVAVNEVARILNLVFGIGATDTPTSPTV